MHKLLQQVMLLGCLLFGGIQLQAQATLSVQGNIIQNFTGAAIDNGSYDITFKLYTTDAGGTPIWTEVQSVNMIGGVYSVVLGAVNPLNVPFDQPYYLGLTLPGGPEHTPRAQLTAAPYALSLLGQDNKFPSTGNVGIGTATPTAKLQVEGSTVLDGSIATGQATTTATSYTVAADDHVIFLDHTANQNVTLPAASTANAGRHLMLVNKAAVAKTLTSSNYVDITGATSTNVPANSVVELQSDGSVWRQTGGYVTPSVSTKARVYCKSVNDTWFTAGIETKPLKWSTEVTDTGNDFNHTTGVFTAPRTGIYHLSGHIHANNTASSSTVFAINLELQGTPTLTNTPSLLYYSNYTTSEKLGNYGSDVLLTAGQTITVQMTLYGGGFPSVSVSPTNPVWNWMTITEQ
jgi:C1q domain